MWATLTCVGPNAANLRGYVYRYNETAGTDIDPTPVIGLLGLVDQLDQRPPGVAMGDGEALVLLGDDLADPSPSLAGSAVAWAAGDKGGALPAFDGPAHTRVADLVRSLVTEGALSGVHDASSGGIGVALAELACRSGLGLHVDRMLTAAQLFAEAPGRVIAVVPASEADALVARASEAGVAAVHLGVGGGDRFQIDGLVDLPLDRVVTTWRDRLPEALGAGTTQSASPSGDATEPSARSAT